MPKKPLILCVDDRADSLVVRKRLLEQFGCEVISVGDAQSGLEAVRKHVIDLVLIDYHLGKGASGEDLARAIRRLHPKLPMIMLTGDPQFPDSARETVDAVLIKGASSPVDMLDLIQDLLPDAEVRQRRPSIIPGTFVRET